MNQCVPSWDLDENPTQLRLAACAHSNSLASNVPSLDYEVAELTWENGQLALHGLGPSRVVNKHAAAAASPTKYTTWDKPRAGGTLESIVNQATGYPHRKSAASVGGNGVNELAPWFVHHHGLVNPAASATMNMDALVPCDNNIRRNDRRENSSHVLESVPGIGTCMVGSCSGAATAGATDGGAGGGRFARGKPCCCCRTNASVSESATCGGRDSRQVTLDSCEREYGGGGLTSTSLWSPENTSSGEEYTRTSGEDHDSVCHSRSQWEAGHKGKRKGSGKSSISAKSRAAAIHNQSERKRRDKINQRMKTLQKLVPNSSKTDKASILDEVIEYLKQLQAQVQMMSRMNMAAMMLPMPMQQQLQMSMMAPAMGMAMGVMDINSLGRAAGMTPLIPTAAAAAAFIPMASWDISASDRLQAQPVMPDLLSAFLASQSQPMTIDAYSRLAALYQQFQQPPAASGSKN